MTQVIVVMGAGSIGQAIARRVSVGKHVLLADLRQDNADAAAKVLADAGFEVSTAIVDVSSRASVHALVETATALGTITGLIHAAGVSPSQASPATILKVDLYGTALVLEEFGNVIATGGSGVVIASQSGHRLPSLTPATCCNTPIHGCACICVGPVAWPIPVHNVWRSSKATCLTRSRCVPRCRGRRWSLPAWLARWPGRRNPSLMRCTPAAADGRSSSVRWASMAKSPASAIAACSIPIATRRR